jgi:hypothetical protein
VVACLAIAIASASWSLPHAIERLDRKADENAALDYADREIAGGNGIVVDQVALYAARALIPRDGSYRVEIGTGFAEAKNVVPDQIATFVEYFLLPRRLSSSGTWIVCYGCDVSRWGERLNTVWSNGDGISVGELRS